MLKKSIFLRKSIFFACAIAIFCTFCVNEQVHSSEKISREGDGDAETLSTEARVAFSYLNKIRTNPAEFSEELQINLSDVKPQNPLVWNEKLARAAENKAIDMATRDYFDHFTPEGVGPNKFAEAEGYFFPLEWPDIDTVNYNESLSGGSSRSGIEHIKNLIFDRGVPHSSPQANHRKHLLGMNNFWEKHTDVGIGFAYNPKSKYKGYLVVMTGNKGPRQTYVSGKIFTYNKQPAAETIEDLWVGAIDSEDRKYWTKVTIEKGQKSAEFSIRVPINSSIIIRYYKEFPDKTFIRGYYTLKTTVTKQSEAEWIAISNKPVENLQIMIME
ncbi:MAG: CAP domain-containing protein [Spirochaetales bacterium]|nr:CAP domain-containing protein [Spirochaetales bacterium]